MVYQEKLCLITVAGRLSHINEEIPQARKVLHAMEYHVWRAWREAWNRHAFPQQAQAQHQAMVDVSEREALSLPLVEEIVPYAERRVWQAMTREETNL